MPLFGRKPLHQRLAEEAGLSLAADGAAPATPSGHPPELDEQFFGERALTFFERLSGEVTAPRPRRWDAVATAEAEIDADEASFVALPDGSLLVEGGADEGLDPLARAVEERLPPPYRAQAVRRSGRIWAVSATRLRVERFDAPGEQLELAVTDTEATLAVDGEPSLRSVPALERIGEQEGSTYVVRATRLDDDLWEVASHRL